MSVRAFAAFIFSHPEQFGWEEASDFEIAKQKFDEIRCNTQMRVGYDMREADFTLVLSMDSWCDFFARLCGHQMFSNATEPKHFLDLWAEIQGFDVDGLLEIGDPAAKMMRQNSGFLAKHDLAAEFNLETDSDNQPDEHLVDQHVHFGQLGDLNLLWLSQINEETCKYWQLREAWPHRNGLKSLPFFRSEPDSAETMQAATASDAASHFENTGNSADMGQHMQRWAENLGWCRLFLFAFKNHEDQPSQDISAQLLNYDRNPRNLVEIEKRLGSPLKFDLQIEELIRLERRLLMSLHEEGNQGLATAYIIAKNTAFHMVASNAVSASNDASRFTAFSNALRALQKIYDSHTAIFYDDGPFIANMSKLMLRSQSFPAETRYRISAQMLKQPDSNRILARHFRILATSTRDNTRAKLTIALHRDDFEKTSTDDVKALLEKIVDDFKGWESDFPIDIVGVDLIGPEARTQSRSAVWPQDGTSTNYLLTSVDTVFNLRGKLADAAQRPIFATFHAGEHVSSFEIGVCALLAVVSDPRFDPKTDRISHALILVEDFEGLTAEVSNEIDSALTKIQRNLGAKNTSKLFNAKQAAEIAKAVENYISTQDRKLLMGVRDLVRRCVETGVLKIEVCPYSNEMIRQNIVACTHPWAGQFGSSNILVGTDDPSLTQTLPTFERLALASGKKELQNRR